jgi:ribosomal protein S11
MEKEKQVRSLKKSVKGSSSKNRVLYKEGKSGVKPTHSSVKFANTESMKKTGVRFVPTESKYDFTVKEASFGSKKDSGSSFERNGKKKFFSQKLSKQEENVSDADLEQLLEEPPEILKPALLILLKRTSNNIFFSVSYRNGLPLYQTSGGSTGIPGSKRDTPASAETAAKLFFNQILQRGYSRCYLRIDGLFDNTTRAAVRGLQSSGLINFSKVQHAKVVAHNGVRLPKARRT